MGYVASRHVYPAAWYTIMVHHHGTCWLPDMYTQQHVHHRTHDMYTQQHVHHGDMWLADMYTQQHVHHGTHVASRHVYPAACTPWDMWLAGNVYPAAYTMVHHETCIHIPSQHGISWDMHVRAQPLCIRMPGVTFIII